LQLLRGDSDFRYESLQAIGIVVGDRES
jgi:hypothetical protein